MPILHPLVAKAIWRDCKAGACTLRSRPVMGIPATAAHMPEAQASHRVCRIGSRGVAVITRTAQEWGVK